MDAMSDDTLDLGAWMRRAYGEGSPCPPPEVFLPSEWSEQSAAERRRLEEHLERCPACAAERDLAQTFEPSPEELAARRDEIAPLVARLRAASPVRAVHKPRGKVLPWRGSRSEPGDIPARSAARRRWLGLAAAAALAAVIGFGIVVPRGDRLEAPPSAGSTVRSATIRAITPEGTLESPPGAFEWSAVATAASYHVRLLDVRGDLLWEATVPGSRAELPGDAAARLAPRVTYRWRVEALDSQGARLAASETLEFRFEASE